MRKLILGVCIIACCFFVFGSLAKAEQVSAELRPGVFSYKINKIIANPPYNGTTDTWPSPTTPGETALSFGTLTELTDPTTGALLGVFGPADRSYYAIDIGNSGGGLPEPFPTVTITYTNSDGDGPEDILGVRATVVYKKMTWVGAGINPTEDTIATVLLSNADRTFTKIDFVEERPAPLSPIGHWIRMYIGLVTNPTADGLPAGARAFDYLTTFGPRSAVLTISIA